MIAIKKILVPTDLSESSIPAIVYAASMAEKHGAELTVLHVLPGRAIKQDLAPVYTTESLIDTGALTGARETSTDSIFERKQRILHNFLREKIAVDLLNRVKISALVRFGKPATEIVAAAKEEQTDLIVMNRWPGLSLRGHLTDRIVKQAPCPLLSLQLDAEIRTEKNERVPLNAFEKWAA